MAPDPERKLRQELAYWNCRSAAEGLLANDHYEYFYTTHFGLAREDYCGKRILDIGCGPRGSLEWADMAEERVGLDPLAAEYLRLGTARHAMRYVAGVCEAIPAPDGAFDVVASFNSLDHVDDLARSLAEIARVTRPGGWFLLLSDVDHAPTVCEPTPFSWDAVAMLRAGFEVLRERHYEKRAGGLYQSIRQGIVYDHQNPVRRTAILSAFCRRRSPSGD